MKQCFIIVFVLISQWCAGQGVPPAPADKAVVYFARPSSMGFAINFSYFDSTKLIGKFNGPKYIRYECTPGKHLFWARSENRDFVEADLEAGKVYLIEAEVRMGGVKAAVALIPIDPAVDGKHVAKILKLIAKKPSESFTQEELAQDTDKDVIARGLEKYQEEKKQGKQVAELKKSMAFQ